MPTPLQTVATPFGELAFRAEGPQTGTPLLLLQRFRGTLDDWDPDFLSRLAEGRRVIRFDNAGIGASGGTVPTSVEGMAEVARAFMDAAGLARADILGWSLGGFVAQHLAHAAPERVRRLIIAGSGPGGVAEGPQSHPRVPEVMAHPHNTEEDFLFLFFTGTDTGRAAGRAHLRRLAALPERVPAVTGPAVLAQMRAIGGAAGLRERLGGLAMPVLVANGVADVMIPAYRSYVIAREAPDAKLVLYPDAGHGFLFQHIADFTAEIGRFLADH
ncbi:alpha/beta fold hydrolase [Methylobacterium frigidaeris]|uniref:Aminoacrylate hydrolase RutD n=1 Tax=Methylobacterium frigidaeris TaxID=2038277 RepID=A0AA37M5Y4_9HYPH|nr:alpha/beta fold hydrolase [Methylobacterium frigidaeris]PIK73587.1 alpha/beta hydrolase [Methylobacterium frigidaeris]GJD64043.1 Putative aminoacrylate hydrolase RutD [Methylobacterium frigidaeris]